MILALRAIQWHNSLMSTDAHQIERAEMLASLRAAEGRIAAGHYTVYDPQTFKDRLLGIYRAAKNAKMA